MSLFALKASAAQIATTSVIINNTVITVSFLSSLICYPVMFLRLCKSTIVYVHRRELAVKKSEKQAFH